MPSSSHTPTPGFWNMRKLCQTRESYGSPDSRTCGSISKTGAEKTTETRRFTENESIVLCGSPSLRRSVFDWGSLGRTRRLRRRPRLLLHLPLARFKYLLVLQMQIELHRDHVLYGIHL